MISITLPSLRHDYVTETIREIYNATKGVEFEIIVVSPFCVQGPRIKWIQETEPLGASGAHNAAFDAASGDIIVAMTDDVAPSPGWLDGIEQEIAEKEARHFPYAGGLHWCTSQLIGVAYGLYYPYFPVMSRRSIEAIGGYYSTDFYYAFCDTDIGLRIWDANGFCEPLLHRVIYRTREEVEERNSDHKNTGFEHDAEVFLKKWDAKLNHRLPHSGAHINVHLGLSHVYDFVE